MPLPSVVLIDTYGASGLVHVPSQHYLGTPPAAASHITGKATAQLCSPSFGIVPRARDAANSQSGLAWSVSPAEHACAHAHTHTRPRHRTRVAGECAALPLSKASQPPAAPTALPFGAYMYIRSHWYEVQNEFQCFDFHPGKRPCTPQEHARSIAPRCCTQSTHPTR